MIINTCTTCKHVACEANKSPCAGCYEHRRWESDADVWIAVGGEPEQPAALNVQIGGSHYKAMPIQPMQYSMKNGLDACQHTVIKYVSRFRDKGGIQDLEKAKHVIDMLIQFESEKA
jgi:hypothetical protein